MAEAARVMQWGFDGAFICAAILLLDLIMASILITVAASRPSTEGNWMLGDPSA